MRSRKSQGAVRSLGGSNPSPSAHNPNRQQRCGNKQERGGQKARLSHRLKPLRTAMDCRATVAHRRRDPSKGEERASGQQRRTSVDATDAARLARSFWRQRAGATGRRYARTMDVSVEREVDGRLAVKLQADAWEVNVRASSDDFMRLIEIRSADWSQRRSIAAGESAGAPVLWACVDDHAALMIGHDDERWDISITLPLDLVDGIVREVAAQP